MLNTPLKPSISSLFELIKTSPLAVACVAEKPGSITSWSIATVAALKAFLLLTQAGKSGPMLQPWSLQTISDRY
tara:strand:+ start:982 stop:1203 length:222 start_codon:yes stop_codon:yes gene_type:complete